MARTRTGIKLVKMLLPVLVLLVLGTIAISVWIVYASAQPPRRPYLVTPEKFPLLSDRGVKVTDESWANPDGSQARGWLLRGKEGAPAVVLLHRFGADRSWLLNLGVKLNETTNYTVLWPDLRAHGESPAVLRTTFGTREADDVAAALDYLDNLVTTQGRPLVGDQIGIFGVELGGYAGLLTAGRNPKVKALVLDSVPSSPDDLLRTIVKSRTGFDNGVLRFLARAGAQIYFLGDYKSVPACGVASGLTNRRVLLLAGVDAPGLRDSTLSLGACFPDPALVEIASDLPLTGYNLPSATGVQGEAYDRRVIEFFHKSLASTP